MSEGECFVVSSGSYSDYRVECVFQRREDAEKYVEERNRAAYERGRRMFPDWVVLSLEEFCESDDALAVAGFDFYPAGVVPVAAPESEGER